MEYFSLALMIGLKCLLFVGVCPFLEKSRNNFGPDKPFVKLRPVYSAKLVFSYVAKRIKIK